MRDVEIEKEIERGREREGGWGEERRQEEERERGGYYWTMVFGKNKNSIKKFHL